MAFKKLYHNSRTKKLVVLEEEDRIVLCNYGDKAYTKEDYLHESRLSSELEELVGYVQVTKEEFVQDLEDNSPETLRVLSFQSKEVLEILLSTGVYEPVLDKAREGHSYEDDIRQLGGKIPIWCFGPIRKDQFVTEDFADGSLFFRFNNEMSLNGTKEFHNFTLLELVLPFKEVKYGLTYNAYLGSKVFSTLKLENLRAVYSLDYTESWYFPKINLVARFSNDILFEDDMIAQYDEEEYVSTKRKNKMDLF